MRFRPDRVLLLAVCLLAFPFRAPAPLVYKQGEGWIYEPAGGSTNFPSEVVLRREALPYDLESSSWNLDKTNAPFRKEPQTSPQHVFRSLLRFGKDTNNAIALIWDQPQSKLYLDLNRNLDLTDDPAGVFSSTNKGFQQHLANVKLPLKAAAGLYPAMLDFKLLTDAKGSWAQARAHSRSLWQAKVTPGREAWQVAVVDNLFGQEGPAAAKFLLLRPWAARTNQMSFYDPTSGIVPFPGQLFWQGQAFHLEAHFDTDGQTQACRLAFAPQQPPLTELTHSGEFISYAVLRDTNGYTAVIDGTPGAVKVPQGVYAVSAVWLKKGPVEAVRLAGEPLVLMATVATNLVLGGPLTNSVVLTRQGRKLTMAYQLVGADGGSYRLTEQDRSRPPEFTVYRNGKKVQSGKFEFG